MDGSEIAICNSYTFANITTNHTIDVYFAPTAVINVRTDNDEQGTATGHYELIDDNMVYILNVTPVEGYELDGIYVDGVKLELEEIDGEFILRNLSEDMNLDVRFKLISNEDNLNTDYVDSPKTGENNYWALWLVLVTLAVLWVVVIVKNKKTTKKE